MSGRFFPALKSSPALLALAFAAGFFVVPANAQSFEEALAQAYATNPTLQAKRAKLRATDETVTQALGNWRPTVTLKGDYGRMRQESNGATPPDQVRNPRSGKVTISQPVFRGGRTVAATRKAENNVLSERAQLLAAEQTLLLSAATAYLDNLRDLAVLELNRNNEQVLKKQMEATRDRFQVGELTRTDVSQAEARLSRAEALRVKAEGDLRASRAAYMSVIGDAPRELTGPAQPNGLPASLDDAVVQAKSAHPDVVSAQYAEKAAQKNVSLVAGELLPTLSLDADAGRNWRSTSIRSRSETVEVLASLSVPIYEGGTATYARVREAKEVAGQRRLEIDQTVRTAIETATKAWEGLETARAQVKSYADQIKASEIALEGVKREAEVGSRTVLDVLDAEQELLDARVNLVKAQRDQTLAAYQLKSAVGKLTAAELGLKADIYDPTLHYDKVHNKWFGTHVDEPKVSP
ncbi:MAG: TolC family outer membrane protein [Alphaproteobacteria bacterium]|nr:TolC family outer membrane protein [Alphaproteobacteria bacterium]